MASHTVKTFCTSVHHTAKVRRPLVGFISVSTLIAKKSKRMNKFSVITATGRKGVWRLLPGDRRFHVSCIEHSAFKNSNRAKAYADRSNLLSSQPETLEAAAFSRFLVDTKDGREQPI